VEAPEGTAAHAVTPFSKVSIAFTVGLPRESKISKASSLVIFIMPLF
jgi:hypothetical protein